MEDTSDAKVLTTFKPENLKESHHWQDLCVDWKIIFKWMLN